MQHETVGGIEGEGVGQVEVALHILGKGDVEETVVLLSVFLTPDAESYARLSGFLVPAANLFVSLLLIPCVFAVGRLKKRL